MSDTQVLSREQMLGELHSWCKNFIKRSADWRRASFEDNWRLFQRHADSTFDPQIAQKKEPWQSKAFWPITASHLENAQGQLYKTEVGPRPPLEVKCRLQVPEEYDQSKNIRDLILREREKSRYEVERNLVVIDKCTYGSGFCQAYFDTVVEPRQVQVPQLEPIVPWDPSSVMRAMSGQRQVIGYKPEIQPQTIYRGIRYRWISIWDVFPDPQALQIKGHPIGLRYKTTYGELVSGAKPSPEGRPGWVIPEAVSALANLPSDEQTPVDKLPVQADRNITEIKIERTEYGRQLECFEIQARLPKKWVLIDGQEIDDPEELIPARIRFHDKSVIAVMLNDSYDGEPDIYKDDYMVVPGQFYARGIPEMLKDVQLVTNESINQRLDAAAISLKKVFAVIAKSIIDPKDLDNWMNGSAIRFKAVDGIGEIDKLFRQVEMTPPDRASFVEPQEWERAAQERTSINRQTLGTAGQVKDANETLGGQQLLLQATGDKLAYIGMVSEFAYQRDVAHAYYKLIYSNYQPDDVALALGPQRAANFIPKTPEEIETEYAYIPMGIFEMENKAQRQARLSAIRQQYAGAPWLNDLAFFDAMLQTADEDPSKFKIPEAEAAQIMMKAGQMARGMAQQMIQAHAAQGPKPPEGQAEPQGAPQ